MCAMPPLIHHLPTAVGCVTLAAGVALVAAPARVGGVFGLTGCDAELRAVGAADLVLVPGLLMGRPRWPWMGSRAALNLAQAAYFASLAGRSSSPGVVRAAAGALASLTAVDGPTALALRRAGA
jgi:hypothetical protein